MVLRAGIAKDQWLYSRLPQNCLKKAAQANRQTYDVDEMHSMALVVVVHLKV